jgi:hypothetical protein
MLPERSKSPIMARFRRIDRIIGDTYPASEITASARDAASVTVRLFEHHGLLDSARLRDEFSAPGLIDD